MITEQQLDKQLQDILASMEEDKEYILTKEAWDKYNQIRKDRGWGSHGEKARQFYSFRVKNNKLFFNSRYNDMIFKDISQATILAGTTEVEALSALFTNQIELKDQPKEDILDGSILEINGEKYELRKTK